MTNKTTFTQKATAARVAKKMGLKEGEFELKLVGKGQWEIVRTNEPAPVATESAPGPTAAESTAPPATEEEPKRELVVVDYADQPKSEPASDPVPAPVATDSKPVRSSKSTIANPTKAVWAVADEMKAANPNVTRKQVIDECVRRGIAFYTARTQYQRWSKAQKR